MKFCSLISVLCLIATHVLSAAEPAIRLESADSAVTVRIGDVETLRYVFRDPAVGRPYFAPVRTLTGVQVSRNHPPVTDLDQTDHQGLHTGIWMSFGDLNGHDYWRLKARTEQMKFLVPPTVTENVGTWTVRNRYLSTGGDEAVCEETARFDIRLVPRGYLLEWTSRFESGDKELIFGAQEEMGLGIRLNTPIAVGKNQGGRILDSEGRHNEVEVWGQTSAWCDYSGPLSSEPSGVQWVGISLLSSSANPHPSWNHARDYGFLAVNPFGRAALTRGQPSQMVIPPRKSLSLRFGVYVHDSPSEGECPIPEVYQSFDQRK